MRCEFCESDLTDEEPANVALLGHVQETPECQERFNLYLENLNASWTPSMSGG